jgi:hypothetical protein
VVGSFVAYLAGVLALTRAALPVRTVAAIACATQLIPLCAPLLLSKDAYYYWAVGRVGAVHAANPYRVPPSTFPNDVAHRYVGADWVDTTPVYGPAFVAASELEAKAVGSSPDGATYIHRILAALAVVAAACFTGAAARRAAFAIAFVGWNPLLALHFAGGGHNDALMMAFVTAALALSARGRLKGAGALWALGVAIKWVAAVPLALLVLAARARGRLSLVAGLATAAALLAALATAWFGAAWLDAFSAGARDATWTSSLSMPFRLEQLGLPHRVALAVPSVAFAVSYAALAWQAWHGKPRPALAFGALLLTTTWLVPWYAIWLVPFAALEDDRASRLLALGLTAYLLRDAVLL